MIYINDIKYACSSCIRGHRSSHCYHENRELFEIKRKGRPVSQCVQIASEHSRKSLRERCIYRPRIVKTNTPLDFKKIVYKTTKKNQKASLALPSNKVFENGQKYQNNLNTLQTDSYITSDYLLNNSDQWIYPPDNSQSLNNINNLTYTMNMTGDDLCDVNSADYHQSSTPNSDSSAEILAYYSYMHPDNSTYSPTLEQSKGNFVSVIDQDDPYQTYDKPAYTNLNTISNYSYMASDANTVPQISQGTPYFHYNQSLAIQNNDGISENSEILTTPQMTISNDFQNYNYESPETYYTYYPCCGIGFQCTCGSSCHSTNHYMHSNNNFQKGFQSIPIDEGLFMNPYFDPGKRFQSLATGIDISI